MENNKKNHIKHNKLIKNALNINLSSKVYPETDRFSSSSTSFIPDEKDYFVKQQMKESPSSHPNQEGKKSSRSERHSNEDL